MPDRFASSLHSSSARLHLLAAILTLAALLIIARLYHIMIRQHDYYMAVAEGAQEKYSALIPERGRILLSDLRSGEEFTAAMNRDIFTVFADPSEFTAKEEAERVAEELARFFSYDEEKKFAIFLQLTKPDDRYEIIEQNLEEDRMLMLKKIELPGIHFKRWPKRVYPEGALAAHVLGFLGKTEDGLEIGRYGIEGYWQAELAGSGGFFVGATGRGGSWIPLAGRSFKPAENGADLLLTIDRTLQFYACAELKKRAAEYEAISGSLIIMDPKTGAIRAMCSVPDFDPNTYNKVADAVAYNNTSIFTPYEPGSIFKPLTMAAALDAGAVTAETVFTDTGASSAGCSKPIRNALDKSYGKTTMIGVLENSINTGMVFVVEQLGKKKFREYVNKFGFGLKEGIELDSEVSGTIDSLSLGKNDGLDCYSATAAFGQGISVTPLQMVTAVAAIANGGRLLKPYIVDEIRYPDGREKKTKPTEIREVITPRTASLVASMLVSVVDKGQSKNARVPGYFIGGKTGTAQIPGKGGYTEDTNHSFIGLGTIDDPKFVMLVKFEKPNRRFADSTAAPTFAAVAKFVLQYYGVAPTR